MLLMMQKSFMPCRASQSSSGKPRLTACSKPRKRPGGLGVQASCAAQILELRAYTGQGCEELGRSATFGHPMPWLHPQASATNFTAQTRTLKRNTTHFQRVPSSRFWLGGEGREAAPADQGKAGLGPEFSNPRPHCRGCIGLHSSTQEYSGHG